MRCCHFPYELLKRHTDRLHDVINDITNSFKEKFIQIARRNKQTLNVRCDRNSVTWVIGIFIISKWSWSADDRTREESSKNLVRTQLFLVVGGRSYFGFFAHLADQDFLVRAGSSSLASWERLLRRGSVSVAKEDIVTITEWVAFNLRTKNGDDVKFGGFVGLMGKDSFGCVMCTNFILTESQISSLSVRFGTNPTKAIFVSSLLDSSYPILDHDARYYTYNSQITT